MERTPKWLKMCRSWNKYYPGEKVNYSLLFAKLFTIAVAIDLMVICITLAIYLCNAVGVCEPLWPKVRLSMMV